MVCAWFDTLRYCARRVWLSCTPARQHATRLIHNENESMCVSPRVCSSGKLASQAGLRAIDDRRLGQGGLIDCLTCLESLQIWLSDASRDISSDLVRLSWHSIHNCRLLIFGCCNLTIHVKTQTTRPTHITNKPGVSDVCGSVSGWVHSWVCGAKQVTRTALDTLVCNFIPVKWLSRLLEVVLKVFIL
jgi:hypothetical protein